MDFNSIIVDAVDQNIRVTVITEAPEAFAGRVKDGHLVKYAKNIQKKLHLPHNMELTHGGDLKTSVLFKTPLTLKGVCSVASAISDMSEITVDAVMAAPRLKVAIDFINSLEPKKLEKDPKSEESDDWEEE